MTTNICRLCLGKDNLEPLFEDCKDCIKNKNILKQTTCLDIDINDGYPQMVCNACKTLIYSTHNFQIQCLNSENELHRIGYKKHTNEFQELKYDYVQIKNEDEVFRIKHENIVNDNVDINENIDIDENIDIIENENIIENSGINKKSNYFIEVKNINQNKQLEIDKNNGYEKIVIKKNKKQRKYNRKERRDFYLSLIDGKFDPKEPIRCKICKKTVSRWTSFITHSKIHTGFNFVCEYCGKKFISITSLKRHCRTFHGMQRELKCSQCDFLAIDTCQLKIHMRSTHTGERPYQCDYCQASYLSKNCLIQHIVQHSSKKTVQCNKCPKKFKSSRCLSRHVYRTHTTKQFTYKCPICCQNYSFKYINVHLRKMHGISKKDVKIDKIKI